MDGTEFKEEQTIKTCTKCGAQLKPDAKFCPECGTPVKEEKAPTNCRKCGAPLNPGAKFCEKCGTAVDAESDNDEITFEDIQENKLISILCYFGIFMLIPFLIRPDSKFVRFHCNQGLILLIFYFICGFVMVIPILGWIVGAIGFIFSAVLFIIGIINVVKGQVKELPLIGKYRIIK